jgi:stage II sporulation protein D
MLRRVVLVAAFAAAGSGGAASSLLAGTSEHAAPPPTTPSIPILPTVLGWPITSTTTAAPPPAAQPETTTTSTATTTLVFTGHGWGHGIGMSQWGAYGYALHGWSYEEILAHYYSGTTLGTSKVATVRVLLRDGARRVALASDGPWRVADAVGAVVKLPAGKLLLTAALEVDGKALAPPLTFSARGPLELGSKPYRGRLVVARGGTRLQVVNAVGVESYLKGVVPSEVPSDWPAEALRAQAVAARSYALASLTRVVTSSNYDLFADERSQVYGGVAAETPATDAAVDDTAGQVVLYDGAIATTYFSASSGGRTVSAREATGKAVPYLVSVPDPYDTYSPAHDWGPMLFDARDVAKALGVPGLTDLQMVAGPSKHVTTVTASGASGQPTALTGNTIRTDLGLRSTWFAVGWLSLDPPPVPVSYGTAVTLTGVARGVGDVTLEARPAGGTWQPVSGVSPGLTGAFSVVVKPEVSTQYRLSTTDVDAGLARVKVAPVVAASVGVGSVAGTVTPALAGAPVQLQLQDGGAWTIVASSTTDASGSFALAAALPPGSYRVRTVPGHGLAPGVSLPLAVQ